MQRSQEHIFTLFPSFQSPIFALIHRPNPPIPQSSNLPILLFLLLLLSSPSLLADKVDSLSQRHDTMLVRFFFYNTDSLDMGKLFRERTAKLENFQRYEPISRNGFYASLGNVGLAHHSLIYQPLIYEGFDFGIHSFREFTFINQNSRYYLHNRPVSYLSYANGPRKEQLLRAMLSHRIFKAVTVAADFSLTNSPGNYYQQKSDDKSLLLTAMYYTKDKRLGVLANYTWNKFLVLENGGILDDAVFENDLETDRALIDVKLNSAENLVRESGGYLNAYFYVSKGSQNDTLREKPRTFHAGRISYTINYNNKSQLFTDAQPLNSYYDPYDTAINKTLTHDSLHVRTLENGFSWSNMRLGEDFSKKIIYVNFAIKHQYTQLTGYADKRKFTQLIPSADIMLHPFSVLTLKGHGHYVLGDFNNNGYLLKAEGLLDVTFKKGVQGILDAEIGFGNQEPGYFYSFYQSNHFRWDTSFVHQNFRWLGAALSIWKFRVGVTYHSVSNYTYLGPDCRPMQNTGNINILQAVWNQKFRWNLLNLDIDLVYQTSSAPESLHLPKLAGRASFYATLSLFKNAAIFQPGIDAFYNTAYFSDGYMPALRSFYWQEEKKTGNHLYADVFISLMIKRFRIFVKYQHLNSLWSKSNYYMVPHYPSQDAAFKFGLSWSFYD